MYRRVRRTLWILVACWVGTTAGFSTSIGSRTKTLERTPTNRFGENTLCFSSQQKCSSLRLKNNDDSSDGSGLADAVGQRWSSRVMSQPSRTLAFSGLMAASGAVLGPFLDSYHSAFGVLRYNEPISAVLWGSPEYPALTTAWWVPELFGLAGFLIGWLYVLLDEETSAATSIEPEALRPSPPKILVGISLFTLQYWLSGILVQTGADRTTILNLMSVVAAVGFWALDGTFAGFLVSAATALGGPLIEVGLISLTNQGVLPGGYHYTDLGETGFFPLWIVPVYFLGGPANGNLARGFWRALSLPESSNKSDDDEEEISPCPVCNDTRRIPCPNCDGVGSYVAMGGRSVICTSCRGRGFVICRACFDRYDEDPYDIEAIRETMARMPD